MINITYRSAEMDEAFRRAKQICTPPSRDGAQWIVDLLVGILLAILLTFICAA